MSIGVLGGIATLMTATVLSVPVWVIFIAWASFFILGAGTDGLRKSVASNLTGILAASLTLLLAHSLGDGSAATALAVGLGSAAMVQASKIRLLTNLPAIVWGFACTVGTSVATGHGITTKSIHNPALVAALAMVLGAAFGIASEYWANAMTRPIAESAGPVVEGQS